MQTCIYRKNYYDEMTKFSLKYKQVDFSVMNMFFLGVGHITIWHCDSVQFYILNYKTVSN